MEPRPTPPPGLTEPGCLGRDARLHPHRLELQSGGALRITRTFSSIQNASDLPGIGGERPIHVDALNAARPHLRLISGRE